MVLGKGFSGNSDSKESACNAGDPGSILAMPSSRGSLGWEDAGVDSHRQRSWWTPVNRVTQNLT